jgi:hypothetical protein
MEDDKVNLPESPEFPESPHNGDASGEAGKASLKDSSEESGRRKYNAKVEEARRKKGYSQSVRPSATSFTGSISRDCGLAEPWD